MGAWGTTGGWGWGNGQARWGWGGGGAGVGWASGGGRGAPLYTRDRRASSFLFSFLHSLCIYACASESPLNGLDTYLENCHHILYIRISTMNVEHYAFFFFHSLHSSQLDVYPCHLHEYARPTTIWRRMSFHSLFIPPRPARRR